MKSRIVTIKDENVVKEYKYEILDSLYREEACYGLAIKRTDYIDEIIVKEVKESVKYVTPDLENAKRFMNLLADNNVSPFHLVDILSEYEDDFIEDFKMLEKNMDIEVTKN